MCNYHFIANRTNRKANNNFFIVVISFGASSTADRTTTYPNISLLPIVISLITPNALVLAPDNPITLLDELQYRLLPYKTRALSLCRLNLFGPTK